ncbi:MAG: hypothetical protein NZ651_05020 [Candidatus Bipolaricaulota bacterium]|nr:hypothetical protein [Candidatus Bipolaricaulota bacterium]MDW8127115.1 hypothetical protein [Candidatus Bipolaricaulota bacterium]
MRWEKYEVVNPYHQRIRSRLKWTSSPPYTNSRAWGVWEAYAPRLPMYSFGPYAAIPVEPPTLPVIRPEDLIRLGIA